MRVFVTGATGFIGTALVSELLAAGHQVLGLARSDSGAAALAAAGAEPHRGALEDLDSLTAGAAASDGVIHLAFNHDFSRFAQNSEDERRAIEAMTAVLAGSERPLIVTSGTAIAQNADRRPALETDAPPPRSAEMPRAAETAAAAALAKGVRTSIVRLPQVHDTRRQGLISYAVAIARQKGVVGYLGDGQNRWAAAHVSDVARLYRLALEAAEREAIYHAVDEEGVTQEAIAEVVGRRLGLPTASIRPEAAADYFGWLTRFVACDLSASSVRTRAKLGWRPTGPGLLADLERLELA